MPNHFHLVIETPRANLVPGMTEERNSRLISEAFLIRSRYGCLGRLNRLWLFGMKIEER
jgi:hypothetical protein